MSILKILHYPDKRLRIIAKNVKKIDKNIFSTIENMIETMYFSKGIGLAATQVNLHIKIIVIDISDKKNTPLILINPLIIKKTGSISAEEGCLSIPNQRAYIKRYQKIKISALNEYGNYFQLSAENLLSICIQHEMDHLIGKLFIDYLSLMKQKRINKKIKKILRINKINNKFYNLIE